MLILSLLSALPKLIEFFQYVWGLIKQVKDPVAKAALFKQARAAVHSSIRAPHGVVAAAPGHLAGHKLDHEACFAALKIVSSSAWSQLACEAKDAAEAAQAELVASLATKTADAPAATA